MKKILIIDDEEGMCWALEKSLNQDGFEVVTTTNGNEGIAIFNSHSFDLVLLDVKLKESNGLLLLEQIRKTNSLVPVLIMTGYSSMSVALEAVDKGATGYLTKPVKVSNLRETVRELLLGESAEKVRTIPRDKPR
ncbi:Response regulator receiver domain-containing protein [Desulfotomaculum arcticum]|uniref:Stage 0 sporulation protein A homolog n=1 Tax=Desulfotruncus arcticus DSM 17038 TaxID=1121424 RepID=A0A1I2SZ95_9FIRM|nr:response regulator [Desulfotruncus arcticus]SFG55536.1 Response regulator receiver domain-containing protein [Desulfotomaculum arcticum] [Desulfotruncus arcticus DSM 17038]